MDCWLIDAQGNRLAKIVVGPESLHVLSDDDLHRKAGAWLARRRQSELWHGCDSMWAFLHEFSLSSENASLPIQVRFI